MSIVNKALEKLKENRAQDSVRRFETNGAESYGATTARRSADASPVRSVDADAPARVVRIDREALNRSGILPTESQRAASTEQYRAMKQDLIRHATAAVETEGAPRRCIMVASALPGDGKTFTSLNLALSMTSERDHDVLLIDGDLAMRHLTRSLSMAEEPGLLDVLRDPAQSFSSIVYATDVPRLFVVPAGKWSEDAAELMACERMSELITSITNRYPQRLLVFDSSPVLLTADARVLAGHVGQIVMVVKAGATLQHDVKEAVALLTGDGRRVTLMLNQIRSNDLLSSIVGYRYGYGYGYEYGARQSGVDAAPPLRQQKP